MSVDLWGACLWLDMEGHRKLVLLSLCENADERGYCWPSREYTAVRASISERRATDHLKALEVDGYMRVVRAAKGPGQRTLRLLNVSRILEEGEARRSEFRRRRLAAMEGIGDETSPITGDAASPLEGDVLDKEGDESSRASARNVPYKGDVADGMGDIPRLRNPQTEPPNEPPEASMPASMHPAIALYEELVGELYPEQHNSLVAVVAGYPRPWWEPAFIEASKARPKRPIKYIRTVLAAWLRDGRAADDGQQGNSARSQLLRRYREVGGVA